MQQQIIITNGTIEVDVTGLTFPEAFTKVNEAGIKAGKTSVRTVFNGQGKAMGMERIIRELQVEGGNEAPVANLALNLVSHWNRAVSPESLPGAQATQAPTNTQPTPEAPKAEPEAPKEPTKPEAVAPVNETPVVNTSTGGMASAIQDETPKVEPIPAPAANPAPAAPVAEPQPTETECDIAPDYSWDDAWRAVANGATLPAIPCLGE